MVQDSRHHGYPPAQRSGQLEPDALSPPVITIETNMRTMSISSRDDTVDASPSSLAPIIQYYCCLLLLLFLLYDYY